MLKLDLQTIKSTIYGGVIGDILGMSVENIPREIVRQMNFKDIEDKETFFTDDTSMTLASMDALIKSDFKLETFMENFVEWLYNGKYTTFGYPYGYGNGTKSAIERYFNTGNVNTCGGTSFNNNGNGALMRITPVCLALLRTQNNWDIIVSILNSITGLTHNHNISKMANVMYCAFLYELIESRDKRIAYRYMINFDYEKYFDKETINYFLDLLEPWNTFSEEPENKRNYGVVDTLKSVMYCIMNTNNFEDSIKCAIRLGYDTDTIAAITGSLTGILYGYENIPNKWLRNLKGKNIVDNLIKEFNKKYGKESDK